MFWKNGDIPWITPADLSGYKAKMIARGARNITLKGLEESGARLMPKGAVLFSSRAPIGYVAIASNPVSTNQGFKSFVLNEGISPDYIYYYLQCAKPLALSLASGTTFLEISGKNAEKIAVVIAPLTEQHRIVEAIESHLTRLDAAVATLGRVKANLKRYRASVLKAAVEGQLVPTEAELARREGRDYESASVLLGRILKERRRRWGETELAKQKAKGVVPTDDQWRRRYQEPKWPGTSRLPELPEGRCWVTWQQVGYSQNGRAFPSDEYQADGVRLLRPGNLHESGRVEWTDTNTRHMPPKWSEEYPTFLVGPGEIVMNLTAQSLKDEFLGRVCMTGPTDQCLLNQRIARLTPIVLDSKYLLWAFKSPVFRRFVSSLNTGSLIQHMFTSQLADFILPLPPLAEQIRISKEVDRINSYLEELDQLLEVNLARCRTTRQSVLKWAFEGKLVDQDPTDEPASILLERIKAEREQAMDTNHKPPRGGRKKVTA